MQPPTTTPTIGEARSHERGHGYGLVLFAAILLLVIGCFNLIYGIAAVAQSHVFTAHAHYVFGDLRSWAGSRSFSAACNCSPQPGCSRAARQPAGSRWP